MTALFNSLPLAQRRLLVLLQNALWDKSIKTHFKGMSYTEWEKIMDLAAIQGVLGIAFDGLKGVPAPNRPPREIMIKWALGVKKIEHRYHHQLDTLKSLAELYRENGIKSLLLKGIGISKLYPVPEHRESGDLDIYLFW